MKSMHIAHVPAHTYILSKNNMISVADRIAQTMPRASKEEDKKLINLGLRPSYSVKSALRSARSFEHLLPEGLLYNRHGKLVELASHEPTKFSGKRHYEAPRFNIADILSDEENVYINKLIEAQNIESLSGRAVKTLDLLRGFFYHEETIGMKPFVAKEIKDTVRLDECAAADICNIEYGTYSDSIAVMDHSIVNFIKLDIEMMSSKEVDKATKSEIYKVLRNIRVSLMNRLCTVGVTNGTDTWRLYTSTAGQQKVGRFMMIKESVLKEHSYLLNFGRTAADFDKGGVNGTEIFKLRSILFTGSVPVSRAFGCDPIDVDRIIVMKDIEVNQLLHNVMDLQADGKAVHHDEINVEDTSLAGSITKFDGQALLIKGTDLEKPVPDSAQCRFGNGPMKFMMGTTTWANIKEYAAMKKKEIPSSLVDRWGEEVKIDTSKTILLMTESGVKGLKYFSSKEDFYSLIRNNGMNELRICAASCKDEEETRKMSRQALQQLIYSTDEELDKFSKLAAKKPAKLRKLDCMIQQRAETWLDYSEKTNAGKLFTIYPELCANADVQENQKEMFKSAVANAMVRPVVKNAHYEYILMDPYAMIHAIFWGIEDNMGLIKGDETCVHGARNGAKIYELRHPANALTAKILKNHIHPIYANMGNVMILSYYGDAIIRDDGDFDGDEAFWTDDKLLVKMTEKVINAVKPELVTFPHEKNKTKIPMTAGRVAWGKEFAATLIRAQENNLVGRYSNLATKILATIGPDMTAEEVTKIVRDGYYAHAMAILMVDFMKTGKVPKEIEANAKALMEGFQKMPYNQRFARHTPAGAQYDQDEAWDTLERGANGNVVDRFGYAVERHIGTLTYDMDVSSLHYNWQDMFRDDIPCGMARKVTVPAGLKAKISQYKAVTENDYCWPDIEADRPVSIFAYFKMMYINSMAIIREMQEDEQSGYDIAEMRKAQITMVREHLIILAKANAANGLTDASEEEVLVWLANQFIRQTCAHRTTENIASRGNYFMFIIDMFGDILAQNVEHNRAIGKVVETPATCDDGYLPPVSEDDFYYFSEYDDDGYAYDAIIPEDVEIVTYTVSYVNFGETHTKDFTDKNEANKAFVKLRALGLETHAWRNGQQLC